jgi:hypothetical protein
VAPANSTKEPLLFEVPPVIATPVGALPEFIADGENGILLDLNTNALGEWIHHEADRSTAAFAALHRDEIERLARSALHHIVELTAKPEKYSAMRRSARSTAIEFFAADDATRYWDELYERAVCGIVPPPKAFGSGETPNFWPGGLFEREASRAAHRQSVYPYRE